MHLVFAIKVMESWLEKGYRLTPHYTASYIYKKGMTKALKIVFSETKVTKNAKMPILSTISIKAKKSKL